MKLTSIDLYSNGNQIAALSFNDPLSKNPYIAQQVTGLDADEIVPKFYGTNIDATRNHYDLVVNKREVVILVQLNPTFSQGVSYSDLRDDLYRGVAASRDGTIQIRLKNGPTTVAALTGFVTKFETGLFSKTPQAQLTIRCDDGMLRSLTTKEFDTASLLANNTIVDGVSTAPHGLKMAVTLLGNSSSFAIQDHPTTPTWKFLVTHPFFTNDVIHLSSSFDGKYIYVDRSSVKTYLAEKVDLGSSWPVIFPGANDISIVVDNGFIWDSLTYYETFWGV